MSDLRITDWSESDAVLYVHPDGHVDGLYTETIDLRGLGRIDVRRLSSLAFDADTQQWIVTLTDGRSIGQFASRRLALEAEIDYFNRLLERGTLDPPWRMLSVLDVVMSVRALNVLDHAGVQTLGELAALSPHKVYSWHNCGRKTVAEFAAVLHRAAGDDLPVPWKELLTRRS